MKILFLSCDELDGFIIDEDIAVQELTKNGHSVSTLSWNRVSDPTKFDCAIIRTTWDYMKRPEEFFSALEKISSGTKLLNDLTTVKWNIHKSYLSRLEKKGVRIVPTVFFKDSDNLNLPADWKSEKFVIKPCVSAGSYKTVVLSREDITTGKYRSELFPGDWMCQPFLPEIFDGELSLVYFNKQFSHALLKVPKKGDFRVQEEFGGDIIPYTPDKKVIELGDKIMSSVDDELLYARVDLVPVNGEYALMELELIEPALYFRTNENAARNFVKALEHGKIR